MDWIMIIVLSFSEGTAREPITVSGENRYPGYALCMKDAEKFAEWLTQDFVKVNYDCYPTLKQAGETAPHQPEG